MRESPCPPQQLEHTKSSIKKTLDSRQHRSKTATTRSLNLRSHSPKVSSQKNLCRLW
ncbi:hypothetical protein ES288_D12G181900v1 [Gossypium darwinii]|uniref:Uncharacterized protein n=2 Tax=Gossypium TaxID=3633 RepID=A0A5D2IBM8_GOSTO|nr:hypothetical protein ES288_D12G181900v1 [Gossypium darwinii]TYH39493.1 hypothetical protein ES332_D12G183100v1 [Gossypium tomentosum]